MTELLNLDEFAHLAAEVLPKQAYEYYVGGANDEITLRQNVDAYARLVLRYRVLVDVSRRDAATRVLGHDLSMPVMVAPTAFQRMAHEDGELATARAAGAAGTVMIVSTLSNTSIEDIAAVATGPLWFQLYVYRDRTVTVDLLQRVEAAGCEAIVLTVDAPVLGTRERDVRNDFQLPPGLTVKNATGRGALPEGAGSGLAAYVAASLDPSLNWSDIEWLRSVTSLPIIIKGIVRGDDAARAIAAGAAGVVVSNHGGRQLDTSPATIDVLPEVVDAVDGQGTVLVDGGVRPGTDGDKAGARGADAVLVGRPVLWGLGVDGEAGVRRVLEILRAEIDTAMALCGCRTVEEITGDLVL